MNFRLAWRHQDGSTVFFDRDGWWSSDPVKTVWLNAMMCVDSSIPTIAAGIRVWLDQECRLLEVLGPDESGNIESRQDADCRLTADYEKAAASRERHPDLLVTA